VTKTRIVMLVSFAVVFAAGMAAGLLLARSARPAHRRSWLTSELDLTSEQREQMREIWSWPDPRSPMRSPFERRRAIREWRDEAVRALLTDEQKVRHDELMLQYERKLAELTEERRKAFEEKVERTKGILTESQRKKYEELLEKGRGSRRRPGGGRPHRRADEPGSGPFRENRGAQRAEVQDGPGGRDESLEE